MRYIVAAMLLLALFSCTQPVAGQKSLVIIGSSTSACLNVAYDSCYVGRLAAYYNQIPPQDTTVQALAVPGYNCFRGMPSSYVPPYSDAGYQPDPAKNITAAIALNPSVIIVNYPTNAYDVLPIDSILYCLRTIRDSANKKGIPCFVTTTQPRLDAASFHTSAVKLKLAILKDSILAEFGSFALDFYTNMINPADSNLLPAYNSGDSVHFNASGHAVLYQRVLAANIFSVGSLPATFLNYNATYNNNTALITWSTAKEVQVAYFEVQRSADGTVFTRLGQVNPSNGTGIYDYRYTDPQPLKGWNYYKIAIVDQDGKQQYSPVFKTFDNGGNLAIKKLITQPAQVILQLQNGTPQNAGLQVLNTTGMLVQKANRYIDAGSSSLSISTAALSSGIYYIKLTTATGQPIIASFIKN